MRMTEGSCFFQLFLFLWVAVASGWQIPFVARRFTALSVSNRGLEVRQEGATPTGRHDLVLQSWTRRTSHRRLPFCHFVRIVLEELNLEYEVLPTTSETKPKWLVDHYEGKMPALRHRKECYTESSVIVDYLLFFFGKNKELSQISSSNEIVGGLFPAVAKYLKHTPDNDDTDLELRDNLKITLQQLDDHLVGKQFWNGDVFTQVDCKLAPQLYHLQCGIDAFHKQIDLAEYVHLSQYMTNLFARPSFQATVYPKEAVEWGWSNARN